MLTQTDVRFVKDNISPHIRLQLTTGDINCIK